MSSSKVAPSSSTNAPNAPNASNAQNNHDNRSYPTTRDMFQTLSTPSCFGPFEIITHCLLLFQLTTLVFLSYIPRSYYLLSFLFWRLLYNVGIGIVLYFQSHYHSITNYLLANQSHPSSYKQRTLLSWLISRSIINASQWNWSSTPISFNTWLTFRSFATIILANDGMAYFVAFIACFTPFSKSSWLTIFFTLPFVLPFIMIGVWAKSRAHHAVGDYGWFWGDFFFIKPDSFIFLGIFNICPHPMYSLGYLFYYAACLLARSYHLFFVSLIAHALQFIFLYLVEQPHIDKIYNSPPSANEKSSSTHKDDDYSTSSSNPTNATNSFISSSSTSSLSPSTSGKVPTTITTTTNNDQPITITTMIPDNPALRLFEQASPHPIVHFALVLFCLITIFISTSFSFSFSSINLSIMVFMICLLTMAFRLIYFILLCICLSRPTHGDNRWVTLLRSAGTSHSRIFSSWQHTILIFNYLNHLLFIICTFISSSFHVSMFFTIRYLSICLFGIYLIIFSQYILYQCNKITGNFIKFYGDFFVSLNSTNTNIINNNSNNNKNNVIYTMYTLNGPFKYSNHPSAICLYLSYYGLILITQSHISIFFLAIFCHVLHLLFISVIEVPHLKREYGHLKCYRDKSPFITAIGQSLPIFETIWDSSQLEIRQMYRKFIIAINNNKHANIHSSSMVNDIGDDDPDLLNDSFIRIDKLKEDLKKKKIHLIKYIEHSIITITQKYILDNMNFISCETIILKLRKMGMIIHDVGPAALEYH